MLVVAAQAAIWTTDELVKPIFDRTIHGEHFAYPSGHTAGATAFALVIGLMVAELIGLGRAGRLLVVLGITAVGASSPRGHRLSSSLTTRRTRRWLLPRSHGRPTSCLAPRPRR